MTLTRQDVVDDLRTLGVGPGMTIMVHSSLSAIGRIEGGAETVIAALIEAVGPEGTVAMPAMSGGVFDIETSPSNVGTITEAFRHYPGVTRSFHPTHSACAIGPNTNYLLAGALDQPTAIGTESAWGRLARLPEGYVLLLGVDQDRSTILHYPEEIVRAPYLHTIQRQYKDPRAGEVKTKVIEWFPGPHRDFIGLEPILREGKAMKIGKVGRAVARLMHAGTTVELVVAALRRDPAAVLCDNPSCDDCVMQRAMIKAHDLAAYDFHASALLDELADGLDRAATGGEHAGGLQAVWNEGIRSVELGERLGGQLVQDESVREAFAAGLAEREMTVSCLHCGLTPEQFTAGQAIAERVEAAARLAVEMGVALIKVPSPLAAMDPEEATERLREACAAAQGTGLTVVFENVPGSCWDTGAACDAPLLELAGEHRLGFAFNPAHFANVGEHPFLGTWRKTKLKRYTRIIYASDGCFPGGPQYTPLVGGNAEVKEVLSIFRCRSFDGFVTLRMSDRRGADAFKAYAAGFRKLLETS
ncbi:MAG TPA: AAC(3) family N-acetyltransferase [Armatimonadota bacterium]|nr:AAC(3) family N-acetyltransferase [Armatimonadota bacterium]